MEEHRYGKTGEQVQTTDCAEESPKRITGEGGSQEGEEDRERGCGGNMECTDPGCEGKE